MVDKRVIVLDSLFIFSWIGFSGVIISMACSLFSGLLTGNVPRVLVPDYAKVWFIGTAILLVLNIAYSLYSCYVDGYGEGRIRDFWARILLRGFLLIGPTVYYLGCLRPKFNNANDLTSVKHILINRVFLDILIFACFWGFVALGLGMVFTTIAAVGGVTTRLFLLMMIAILPVCILSNVALNSILLLDATRRSTPDWDNGDYWKLVAPGASILRLRRYYTETLRPQLTHENESEKRRRAQ